MPLRQRLAAYIATRVTKWITAALRAVLRHPEVHRRLDMIVADQWEHKRQRIGNPVLRAGAKYYSQNDEDGILAEILRRLSKRRGVFVEFGVGDGLENNTLLLLMGGWRGVWIGGEPLKFKLPAAGSKLSFVQAWITQENCVELMQKALGELGESKPDLVSIDLDGNDLHILRELLAAGTRPEVLVVEYNGKFPPPIRFSIPYRDDFVWDGSDYFGASLQSFVDVLDPYGYKLVCCNVTGLNAFFVGPGRGDLFPDVDAEPSSHFVASAYLGFYRAGHPPAASTIEAFLRE